MVLAVHIKKIEKFFQFTKIWQRPMAGKVFLLGWDRD